MRMVLLVLAVGCLLFSMLAPQAHADDSNLDARFWLKADVRQNYTDYVDRIGEQGQCSAQWVSVSKNRCVTYTQWGEVSEDGIRMSTNEFYPLQLTNSQHLQRSPDSRRLYISENLGTGYMRLGYIENPQEDIVFDSGAGTYKLAPSAYFSFLPTQYKNLAFSNNSYYAVGEAVNNTLTRIALTNFSRKIFRGNSPAFDIAQTERWAISTDGNLVVGANGQNEMIAYELGHCNNAGEPDVCDTKKISTAQTMSAPGDKIYITDGGRGISLYSLPQGLRTSRISLNLNYESLNRPVTYVALGDSFSSGEGAWGYDNNTDGTGEYFDEKCHQSSSAYPEQYFRHYLRWSDEYYEPNLEGDMVMWLNSFKNATCSGAKTEHLQSFDGKLKTNTILQNGYEGQFSQMKNKTQEEKDAFFNNAVSEAFPGRALQINFLHKYNPTIATVGIGGNDIGFSGAIEACISSIKTCPHASSKKSSEGKKIQNEFKRLDALFLEMQRASPDTKFYAVSYPKIIVNDDYVCGPNVLLDAWEREYIKKSTEYLNQVIKAAAAKNGFGYIDFENAIGSRGLCGNELGVNGLSFGNDQKEVTLLGKKYALFANESYHPTSYGQELMANKLINTYGELDIADYPTCNKTAENICSKSWINAPSMPSYFGSPNNDRLVSYKNFTSTVTAGSIPIQVANFLRNSSVKITIFSEPYVLGTFMTNESGSLNRNISLPAFIEPGYHTLYLEGTNDDGEAVEYQQVFLYLPEDTKLGPCSFLPYSNLDQDEDGIDDACDPEISVENALTFADPSEYLTYPNPERPRPATTTPTPTSTLTQDVLGTTHSSASSPIPAVLVAVAPTNPFTSDAIPVLQNTAQITQQTTQNSTKDTEQNEEPTQISSSNLASFIAVITGGSIALIFTLFLARKVLRR